MARIFPLLKKKIKLNIRDPTEKKPIYLIKITDSDFVDFEEVECSLVRAFLGVAYSTELNEDQYKYYNLAYIKIPDGIHIFTVRVGSNNGTLFTTKTKIKTVSKIVNITINNSWTNLVFTGVEETLDLTFLDLIKIVVNI